MEVNKIYIFQNKVKRSVLKLAILDITNTTIKSLNLDTDTIVRMKLEAFTSSWEVLEPIGDYNSEERKIKPLILIKLPIRLPLEEVNRIKSEFTTDDYHVFTMPTNSREGSIKVFFEKDYETLTFKEFKKSIEVELLKLKFNDIKEPRI